MILSRAALIAMRPVIEAATAAVAHDLENHRKTWSAHDSFTGRCLHDLGIPMYNLGHDYSAWDFATALRLAWPSQWRRFTRGVQEMLGLQPKPLPGMALLGNSWVGVANVHYVKTREDMLTIREAFRGQKK